MYTKFDDLLTNGRNTCNYIDPCIKYSVLASSLTTASGILSPSVLLFSIAIAHGNTIPYAIACMHGVFAS